MIVSYGGFHLLAGQGAVAENGLPASAQPQRRSFFVSGAQFYLPPNPPIEQLKQLLADFGRKYQFNTVRTWTSWAYHNSERHKFDFAELDALMSMCDELGLKVLVGISLEDAPFWLEAAHPESRYVNAFDRVRHLGGRADVPTNGSPGLCRDSAPIREAAGQYIRKLTQVVSSHASLYAFDCWNEPHSEPSGLHTADQTLNVGEVTYCYCANTIAEFQKWLQRKYGTLAELEKAWYGRYPDWSMIDPPREVGTYLNWIDWRRFTMERATLDMRFRVEQVRLVNTDVVLESHLGFQVAVESPLAVLGVNPWRLAEEVSVWGLSYFPHWGLMGGSLAAGVCRFELTRSQAGDKPFWITELQGGYSRQSMRPSDIRLWNWLAVATGAKGLLYWCYHPQILGVESTNLIAGTFNLVDFGGGPTERVLEAAKDHRLIEDHWDIIQNYRPSPQVAILFDQDSALLSFAGLGSEYESALAFQGYYKALWQCDLWADFIEGRGVANKAYKVIIAPFLPMLTQAGSDVLKEFVEAGGTLILQGPFAENDERALRGRTTPRFGLDDIFGYREKETYALCVPENNSDSSMTMQNSDRLYEGVNLEFSVPIKVRAKAHHFLTFLNSVSATIIGHYKAMPIAIKKAVGRGQVYYFGTNLGGSIAHGDQGSLDLMRAILSEVVRPSISADKVRPRLIEGTDRSLLVVCNETATERKEKLRVPPRYTQVTDLYTTQHQSVRDNSLLVTVPAEGVSVFLLK